MSRGVGAGRKTSFSAISRDFSDFGLGRGGVRRADSSLSIQIAKKHEITLSEFRLLREKQSFSEKEEKNSISHVFCGFSPGVSGARTRKSRVLGQKGEKPEKSGKFSGCSKRKTPACGRLIGKVVKRGKVGGGKVSGGYSTGMTAMMTPSSPSLEIFSDS